VGRWYAGGSQNEDGTHFTISCVQGSWTAGVRAVERLVPVDAEEQFVLREATYQLDEGAAQKLPVTLRESSLYSWQTRPGSSMTQYGQDLAAALLRGDAEWLTLKFKDGANKEKAWRFNVKGSRNDKTFAQDVGCPTPRKAAQ
jgi:hypothetical protein